VGYLRRDLELGHPDFGKVFACPCRGLDLHDSFRARCGLTEREQRVRLSKLKLKGRPGASRMLEACRKFVEEPRGILTIWGPSGSGKTMALHALVNEALDAGREAVYVTTHDLIDGLRRGMAGKHEGNGSAPNPRMQRYARVEILALDGFDNVHSTEWTRAELSELIDLRYRLGLDGKAGTLIAMNGDPTQLPTDMASRLTDGRNLCVHNEDGDLRLAMKR
jgi:chromosomal replication initiation ATPase DnaA